jgi:peptidoglycan/xylan/chitin deacetylase (PgdA/CDA1 family)
VSRLRPLLRKAAFRSGALHIARHRVRRALTVVMLHRVIDPADPDFGSADPTYTLSLPLFVDFLKFLQAHYETVRLADVMAAQDGTGRLPEHALLVTFDDGWADNLRYAAPAMAEYGIPAVVFVVAEAILARTDAWWHERVFTASRDGTLTRWVSQLGVGGSACGPAAIDVVAKLGLMDEAAREELLLTLSSPRCSRRMMLEPEELAELARYGIDIGLHGYSHVPLTRVPDVAVEMARAGTAIKRMSGGASSSTALGCPHGLYDTQVVQSARHAGIKHIFTSDPWLNSMQSGTLARDRVLGRINVSTENIVDGAGRFDPSAAARWLWAREAR